MNWETLITILTPMLTGFAILLYKLGNIDTRLNFMQKTIDGMLVRMDRFEIRLNDLDKRLHRNRKRK